MNHLSEYLPLCDSLVSAHTQFLAHNLVRWNKFARTEFSIQLPTELSDLILEQYLLLNEDKSKNINTPYNLGEDSGAGLFSYIIRDPATETAGESDSGVCIKNTVFVQSWDELLDRLIDDPRVLRMAVSCSRSSDLFFDSENYGHKSFVNNIYNFFDLKYTLDIDDQLSDYINKRLPRMYLKAIVTRMSNPFILRGVVDSYLHQVLYIYDSNGNESRLSYQKILGDYKAFTFSGKKHKIHSDLFSYYHRI